MKYYWICYKESSMYDGKGGFEEIVINVHPFLWIPNSSSGRILINWKEITIEEFELFRGVKEHMNSDYSPEKRQEEIFQRMSRLY